MFSQSNSTCTELKLLLIVAPWNESHVDLVDMVELWSLILYNHGAKSSNTQTWLNREPWLYSTHHAHGSVHSQVILLPWSIAPQCTYFTTVVIISSVIWTLYPSWYQWFGTTKSELFHLLWVKPIITLCKWPPNPYIFVIWKQIYLWALFISLKPSDAYMHQ